MGFWLTELQTLEALLGEIESNPGALENLRRVDQTLSPGNTAPWAINEVVTVSLHRMFLYPTPKEFDQQRSADEVSRRREQVLDALRQIGGDAATVAASIVEKLSTGETPISTPAFWDAYFDLLESPSEFRVEPVDNNRELGNTFGDTSWHSIELLLKERKIKQARETARRQYKRDDARKRKLSSWEDDIYRRVLREAETVERLEERARRNAALLKIAELEETLRELHERVIDSPTATELKGQLPELRRHASYLSASPHSSELVNLQLLEDVRFQISAGYYALCSALAICMIIRAITELGAEDQPRGGVYGLIPAIAGVLVAFGFARMLQQRTPHAWAWAPLAFIGSTTLMYVSFGEWWLVLVATVIFFLGLLLMERPQARLREWERWNDFVHQSLRLTGEDNGGGIHTVVAIEDSYPWIVTVEPLEGAPEPFSRITEELEPEFGIGDYVILTRGGSVHAWSHPLKFVPKRTYPGQNRTPQALPPKRA